MAYQTLTPKAIKALSPRCKQLFAEATLIPVLPGPRNGLHEIVPVIVYLREHHGMGYKQIAEWLAVPHGKDKITVKASYASVRKAYLGSLSPQQRKQAKHKRAPNT